MKFLGEILGFILIVLFCVCLFSFWSTERINTEKDLINYNGYVVVDIDTLFDEQLIHINKDRKLKYCIFSDLMQRDYHIALGDTIRIKEQ